MKLIRCTACKGKCYVECCGSHMCPGTTKCLVCNGKGKLLSPKDKAEKKKLLKLLEYN